MKFILVSNILENSGFINFLEDALVAYPDARFIVTGDFLNIFPETREQLQDSMFYELYGKSILDGMHKLNKFTFGFLKQSPFTTALQEMFFPMGEYHQKAQAMAMRRYEKMFSHFEAMLEQNSMYFVPGDMDYPLLTECVTRRSSCFHSLDSRVITLDGTKFAGIGGTPNNLKPVRGMIDLTPNEMVPDEFTRRLNNLSGVDVLVTHVAPEESRELRDFIKKSQLKLVICRAPFVKRGQENFRGKLETYTIKNTCVIKVSPFDTANHQVMIIDITDGNFEFQAMNIFEWGLPIVDAVAV